MLTQRFFQLNAVQATSLLVKRPLSHGVFSLTSLTLPFYQIQEIKGASSPVISVNALIFPVHIRGRCLFSNLAPLTSILFSIKRH